ncbi:MAG: VPLPA-CTERM sorting domain-containing protein [Gammaproteobacteria bacterium]|nr:VPLPA-CTERM sorting domain-containing protein [Gammaproteobacteria bacterium]
MMTFRPRSLWVLALAALLNAAPVTAATVLADYTLNFKPPNPTCTATDLGDLSGATLSGTPGFAYLDDAGNLVQVNPGPVQIGGLACGASYSGSFSFDAPGISPGVSVGFGGVVERQPGPINLPLYAFAAGTDPAGLADPGSAPWISLGAVALESNPGPVQLPLYAFSSGVAYQVGTFEVTLQAVPLPAALWLFGSGVAGLIGVARRRQPVGRVSAA